jgi:hypothetical protein
MNQQKRDFQNQMIREAWQDEILIIVSIANTSVYRLNVNFNDLKCQLMSTIKNKSIKIFCVCVVQYIYKQNINNFHCS